MALPPTSKFAYDPLLQFAGYILHGDDYTGSQKLRAHQLVLIDDLLRAFKRFGLIPEELVIDTPLCRIAFRSMLEPLFSVVAPNLAESEGGRHGRHERDITLYALTNYLVFYGPTIENAQRFLDCSNGDGDSRAEIQPFLDRASNYFGSYLYGRHLCGVIDRIQQFIRQSQEVRHQYYAGWHTDGYVWY